MLKNLVIINNEKCIKKDGDFYCQNIEVSSITKLLSRKFNIKLILRESSVNPIYKISSGKVISNSNIFSFVWNVVSSALKDKSIFLIISVTPYTFLSFLFLLFMRKKVFLYLRSDGKKEISIILGKVFSIIYRLMEGFMIKFSNLIVVNNLITKKSKFHLVNPSQIDSDWYENTKVSQRSQIKLLYVGRLKIEKGVYSLIEIFKQIKSPDKEIFLTLIGEGKKPGEPNEKIRFLEPISIKTNLINQYDEHDIFILPSYTEGYPQVVLESLIRKRPVIIFDEIKHVSKNFQGVFVTNRNPKDLLDTISFIDKNYNQILENMEKNKYPTKEDFFKQLNNILCQN